MEKMVEKTFKKLKFVKNKDFAGSKYYGSVKNNERHGYGVCIYSTSEKYEGEWFENKKHG